MANDEQEQPLVRFRLNHLSTITAPPESPLAIAESPFLDPGTRLEKVPVVRIYGTTEGGQKICANVWGAFPYVYVEYRGGKGSPDEIRSYIRRFQRSLNAAMFASFKRGHQPAATKSHSKGSKPPQPKPQHDSEGEESSIEIDENFEDEKEASYTTSAQQFKSERIYVPFVVLCKGVPFYGCHFGYQYYLKVYCSDPRHMNRLCSILRAAGPSSSDQVGGGKGKGGRRQWTGFTVYEQHIPFPLQFLCDHNLYGCGWVDVGLGAKFRRPLPDGPQSFVSSILQDVASSSSSLASLIYTESQCPSKLIYEEGSHDPVKTARTPLELDLHVSQILSRHGISERDVHCDFREFLKRNDEKDGWAAKWKNEKLVSSVKEFWEEEAKRRKDRGKDEGKSQGKDKNRASTPFLQPHARHVDQLEALKQQSLSAYASSHVNTPDPKFDTFIQKLPWEDHVRTAFQSVTALFPDTWRRERKEHDAFGVWGLDSVWGPQGTRGATQDHSPAQHHKSPEEEKTADEDVSLEENRNEDKELEWMYTQAANNGALSDPLGDEVGNGKVQGATSNSSDKSDRSEDDDEVQDEEPAERKGVREDRSREGVDTFLGKRASRLTPPPKTPELQYSDEVEQRTSLSTSPRTAERNKSPLNLGPRSISPTKTQKTTSLKRASRSEAKVVPETRFSKRARTEDPKGSEPSVCGSTYGDIQTSPLLGLASKTLRKGNKGPLGRDGLSKVGNNGASNSPTILSRLSSTDQSISFDPATTPKQSTTPNDSTAHFILRKSSSRRFTKDGILSRTASRPRTSFASGRPHLFNYAFPAPDPTKLLSTLEDHRLPRRVYSAAFYGQASDVPNISKEYGGRDFRLKGEGLNWLKDFHDEMFPIESHRPKGIRSWQAARPPPTLLQLRDQCVEDSTNQPWALASQFIGPTQGNLYGFKYTPMKSLEGTRRRRSMDVLSLELHVNTRDKLLPDPKHDPISGLFYCFHNDNDHIPDNGRTEGMYVGCILVDNQNTKLGQLGLSPFALEVVENEFDLMSTFLDLVDDFDPDILTGYEIQSASWGYLIERAGELDFDILNLLGRAHLNSNSRHASKESDRWGYTHGSTLKVDGRHCLPIWRILRGEINLNRYSFENVVFHILKRRIPRYDAWTLTSWFSSKEPHFTTRVLDYFFDRVQMDVELLEEAEIVSRNAEFARLFGIDFLSVLNRGSQYKVESVMLKIAKPENFMLPSPTRQEVGKQNAAECIPLILEPQSAFYKGPLLVLDFQSLYPSVMIAYNLCYSTCLGRVSQFKGTNKLGTGELGLPDGLVGLLKDDIFVSTNGIVFVKEHVRRSLLSKMLSEFLDTRVMVKNSMKDVKDDKSLLKILNARQLGLKFICNVTYGYTSATFSGRMPLVEIADAIVQTGRETLEKSLHLIESNQSWGAKVVYGDTDSLFVYLPGKTKDDAFRIGNEIANDITRANPDPVKLKFEKVYLPSVLLAKKRYVGFKYENVTDIEPEFDAKGIETVRRDGTPALQKLEETSLKILFRTRDLSKVKAHCQEEWYRIMTGAVSPHDFFYAKEVKLGTYSENGIPPVGAVIAARKMKQDPRAEPAYNERVPYILIQAPPGTRQIEKGMAPDEFLADSRNRIDFVHYIERHFIPPLSRIFNLVGADVRAWWNEMPKSVKSGVATDGLEMFNGKKKKLEGPDEKVGRSKSGINQHFRTEECVGCGVESRARFCSSCQADASSVSFKLLNRAKEADRRRREIQVVCGSCSSIPPNEEIPCASYDCPILYSRTRANRRWERLCDMELNELWGPPS